MIRRITRRETFRLAGLAAAWLHPPIIAGCGSAAARDGDSDERDEPFEPPEFDPTRPWWLQHNYGPVDDERDAMSLEVDGAIPPELDGLYVRNGSNPSTGDAIHWFVGDGMLHGVRIKGGRAEWYKNRYVRTPQLASPPPPGTLAPPTLTDNASNVSLVHHAGRLLTLGEVGLPYEIDPTDLGTRGAFDYAGLLQTAMTAHPKVDAVTGEMLMFGYAFAPPYLTYHRVDASGALVQSENIDIPASSMMHDFQVTATRVVFMDLPILFDLAMAIENLFPFRWDDAHGARFGVMPREGSGADVRWFEIDDCFIFHTMNAYDDPDDPNVVVLEAVRHAKLWVDGPNDFDSRPALWRYRIHLDTNTVDASPIDDRLLEFPQLDRRLVGRKNRIGYGLWLRDPAGTPHPPGVRGVLKYDLASGSVVSHDFAEYEHADEAIFVEASGDASEGDGFLMSYVYDARENKSHLLILDATNVESEPIARIHLPFRVPFGFHGVWVPA